MDGSVDYYGAWNGARGYLHSYGFNGGTDFSNGLYYVHGRWWNPATGLFMSPDDKGEYFYGSGQDAVNDAWIVNAFIGFGKSGDVQRQIVLGSSQFIQESVVATHYAFYPPPNWTLVDRFGNAARAYEPVLGVQLLVSGGLGAKALVGRGVVFIRTLIGGGTTACAIEEEQCTNTAENSAQSVWAFGNDIRGEEIEGILGGRSPQLPWNFPVIDRFENGVATSIKSIDLSTPTYQNIGRLTYQVQKYVADLASWQGADWGGIVIRANQITERQLLLAIPPVATPAQMTALQQLQQWAASQNVTFIISIVP